MSRSARSAVLVTVLAFHVLAVAFLVRTTATRVIERVADIVSTDVFVPVPEILPQTDEPPAAREPAREPQTARTPAPPRAQEESTAIEAPWVDWHAAAERAAQAITRPNTYRPVGRPEITLGPVRSPSTRRPVGEVYRDDATGQVIRWLNEDCYQVVGTVTAGVPPAGAVPAPARIMCSGKSKEARGDLFKDLPSYKRHRLPEPR
jgi:hypothetical protein